MQVDTAERWKDKAFKKAILISICIALLLTGWVCLAGAVLEKTLFNPGYYRAVLDELALHDRVQAYYLESVFKKEGDGPLEESSFLRQAINKAVSLEWLKEQTDRMVEQIMAFVKGEQHGLHITVDLGERLEVFEQELVGLLSPKLAQLELTEADVAQFIAGFGLPGRLTLLEIDGPGQLGPGAEEALAQIRQARVYFRVVPYIVLGLLVLLCLLWAGPAGGLKWAGAGLLAGGLTSLLLFAALRGAAIAFLARELAGYGLSGGFFAGGAGVAAAAFNRALPAAAAVCLVYAAAGAALLLAGFADGRKISAYLRSIIKHRA